MTKYAKLIYDAFQYQIAKEIGAMAVVLKGKVDAIVLTGGISHDKGLVANLTEQVGWIAPIEVRAGEFEMEALAAGGLPRPGRRGAGQGIHRREGVHQFRLSQAVTCSAQCGVGARRLPLPYLKSISKEDHPNELQNFRPESRLYIH